MGMMDAMVKIFSKKTREGMMIDMMPKMMDGIDMAEFMPRMMVEMFNDVTAEDVVQFLREAIKKREKFKELADKIVEANLMKDMMFASYRSRLGFDETVTRLHENALKNGWEIPDVRNLQEEYHRAGLTDMTKMKVLYFCNPRGGYDIIKDDANKPMSVMMPTGVSVYEKSDGTVEIAAMNLGMMSGMMPAEIREVLSDGGERLEKSLEGII